MKKYLTIAFAALLLVLLPACHHEDPELDLNAAESVFNAAGGTNTVSFTCNYKWTAKSSAPWVRVSPESGAGGQNEITLTIEPNNGTSSRTATVSITCEELMRVVRVTQDPPLNQTLSLVFTGKELVIPAVTGNGVSGEIDWGDGQKEDYKTKLKHTYGAVGNHTVTIKLAGGSSLEIETVAGMSEIDLTEF